MLAKKNRLLTADDFRAVVRRGRREASELMVVSSVSTGSQMPARFGFIVTKKVGNAVSRNLVRRRLRAVAREMVDTGLSGLDVVVRPLPASATTDWTTLRCDLVGAVNSATMKGSGGR